MKQVIYGLIVGLIILLGIGIVVTVNGKTTRGGGGKCSGNNDE